MMGPTQSHTFQKEVYKHAFLPIRHVRMAYAHTTLVLKSAVCKASPSPSNSTFPFCYIMLEDIQNIETIRKKWVWSRQAKMA